MVFTTDLDGGDGVGSVEEDVREKGDVKSDRVARAEEEGPWPFARRENKSLGGIV